jgi:hypothetical protein
MKRLLIIGIGLAVIIFALTSCAMNHTKDVAEKLQPEDLYAVYNTKPVNLKAQSKCPLTPSINVVNVETQDGDYTIIYPILGPRIINHIINPKELMNGVVDYLKDALEKSGVKADNSSSKIIQVSLEENKILVGLWGIGAIIRLKVEIPETKYTKIYEAEDWTGRSPIASMAYSVHVVTQKIINDPVIQNYILCKYEYIQTISDHKKKDETTSISLSQKLHDLQTALDNGLISKEEYQRTRQRLLEKY